MAPVPSHAPGLHDFYASSPRLFWTILGIFAFAFIIILGSGIYKLAIYSRTKVGNRASFPSYIEKSWFHSFFLRRLSSRRAKDHTWLDKMSSRIHLVRTRVCRL